MSAVRKSAPGREETWFAECREITPQDLTIGQKVGDGRSWLRHEFVADVVNGQEVCRVCKVDFEFLPQCQNVRIHRASKGIGVVPPYIAEQLIARDNPFRVL